MSIILKISLLYYTPQPQTFARARQVLHHLVAGGGKNEYVAVEEHQLLSFTKSCEVQNVS